jgi:Voltage gated chloride channel
VCRVATNDGRVGPPANGAVQVGVWLLWVESGWQLRAVPDDHRVQAMWASHAGSYSADPSARLVPPVEPTRDLTARCGVPKQLVCTQTGRIQRIGNGLADAKLKPAAVLIDIPEVSRRTIDMSRVFTVEHLVPWASLSGAAVSLVTISLAMRRVARRYCEGLWRMAALKRNSIFVFAAVVTGLISIIFGPGVVRASPIFRQMTAARPWLVFALCPGGFAVIVFLTRKVFPGAQGSGIPQATAALKMRDVADVDSVLSLRIAIGKFLLTLLGFLVGASTMTVPVGVAAILGTLAPRLVCREPVYAAMSHQFLLVVEREPVLEPNAVGIALEPSAEEEERLADQGADM